MAEGRGVPLMAVGAIIGLLVMVDFFPSVNSVKEDISPMKMSAKMMGPSLKFLYW